MTTDKENRVSNINNRETNLYKVNVKKFVKKVINNGISELIKKYPSFYCLQSFIEKA